jgi:hypothetical protein
MAEGNKIFPTKLAFAPVKRSSRTAPSPVCLETRGGTSAAIGTLSSTSRSRTLCSSRAVNQQRVAGRSHSSIVTGGAATGSSVSPATRATTVVTDMSIVTFAVVLKISTKMRIESRVTPPAATALAVEATPVMSSANTSGTILIRSASSHSPPATSATKTIDRSGGVSIGAIRAPARRPRPRPSRMRTAGDD